MQSVRTINGSPNKVINMDNVSFTSKGNYICFEYVNFHIIFNPSLLYRVYIGLVICNPQQILWHEQFLIISKEQKFEKINFGA
jgi:hypothetical protein